VTALDDVFVEEFSRTLARLSAMLVVFVFMYYLFSQFARLSREEFIGIVKEAVVSAVARW
jgi:hypothetical protein